MKQVLATCFFLATSSVVFAACPDKPAPLPSKYFAAGDQKVNAAWLQKTLGGKTVGYSNGGREIYKANGSYEYRENGQRYKAATYKFYDNGLRCIGYENSPRFDLYVVNSGQLVLVNVQNKRYVAKVR